MPHTANRVSIMISFGLKEQSFPLVVAHEKCAAQKTLCFGDSLYTNPPIVLSHLGALLGTAHQNDYQIHVVHGNLIRMPKTLSYYCNIGG